MTSPIHICGAFGSPTACIREARGYVRQGKQIPYLLFHEIADAANEGHMTAERFLDAQYRKEQRRLKAEREAAK